MKYVNSTIIEKISTAIDTEDWNIIIPKVMEYETCVNTYSDEYRSHYILGKSIDTNNKDIIKYFFRDYISFSKEDDWLIYRALYMCDLYNFKHVFELVNLNTPINTLLQQAQIHMKDLLEIGNTERSDIQDIVKYIEEIQYMKVYNVDT